MNTVIRVFKSGPSGLLVIHDRYSRAMSSKGAIKGQLGHKLVLLLDIVELQIKSKRKGRRCF